MSLPSHFERVTTAGLSEEDKKEILNIFGTVRQRGEEAFVNNPLSELVDTYGFNLVENFIEDNRPKNKTDVLGYEWDEGSSEKSSIEEIYRLDAALDKWLRELRPHDDREQGSMENYMDDITEDNIGEARRWDLWKQALEQSADDPELRAQQVLQIKFVAAYLKTSALDVRAALDQLHTSDESWIERQPESPMGGVEFAQTPLHPKEYQTAYQLAEEFYYTYQFGPNAIEALKPTTGRNLLSVVQNRLALFILKRDFYEVEIEWRLHEAQKMREELETFLLLEATGNAVRTKDPEKLAEARKMIYVAGATGTVPAEMLRNIASMLS